MTDHDMEQDASLTRILDEARAEWRARRVLDVPAWQARYPALADELAGLLETLRDLDTAADDWREVAIAAKTWNAAPRNALRLEAGPIPDQIGRYRILALLGSGGMGVVYKAEDPHLKRIVAVKVPRLDAGRPDQDRLIQRFLREARAAAGVQHPHVCAIHDVGEQEGVPYVVMAFVEGSSLAQRLAGRRGFEDIPQAVELARQVAEALNAVHDHGIIHRDLKPGNVLLDRAGKAILTDFGLARPEEDSEHLTQDGAFLGTPAYMAPEQAQVQAEGIGPWSDVYSLGVVLYQMLTGRLPFPGLHLAAVSCIPTEALIPPSRLRGDLDPALESIVCKALARRPEDRYRDARALATALSDWQAGKAPLTPLPETVASEKSTATVVNVKLPDGSPVKVGVDAGSTARAMTVQVREQPAAGKRRRRLAITVTITFSVLFLVSLTVWMEQTYTRIASVHEEVATTHAAEQQFKQAAEAQFKMQGDEARRAQARVLCTWGMARAEKGDLDGAIAAYRQAISLEPKDARTHANLGNALKTKGHLEEAIAAYRQAIELEPTDAETYLHLGNALESKGDREGAIAACRQALKLDPKDARAHTNVGNAAINLEPKDARALANLGTALRVKERLLLAHLCRHKHRNLAAVQLYSSVFAEQPKLTDPSTRHRYEAACAAALAAAGQGEDADKLDRKEKERLREQARTWLQDDLDGWTKTLAEKSPQARAEAQRVLMRWRDDARLASLRDRDALNQLAEGERRSWAKFWAKLDDLLETLRKPK